MAVLIKPYMPSPAVTQQVGKIVIRQGQLDHLLKLTIKSLLGISIHDPLYTEETERVSSKLRERVKELAATKLAAHEDILNELIEQIDKIGKFTDFRNNIVHGVWSRVTTGGPVKLRDSKNDKRHPLPTVKELRDAEAEMYELFLELNNSRLKGKLKQALLKVG
jgi:hypothetical protein